MKMYNVKFNGRWILQAGRSWLDADADIDQLQTVTVIYHSDVISVWADGMLN